MQAEEEGLQSLRREVVGMELGVGQTHWVKG